MQPCSRAEIRTQWKINEHKHSQPQDRLSLKFANNQSPLLWKCSQPTQFWWAFFSIFDNWKEWKKWCFRSQQMRREGGEVITNWDGFLTAKKTHKSFIHNNPLCGDLRQKKSISFSTVVEHSFRTSELNSILNGPILFVSVISRGEHSFQVTTRIEWNVTPTCSFLLSSISSICFLISK